MPTRCALLLVALVLAVTVAFGTEAPAPQGSAAPAATVEAAKQPEMSREDQRDAEIGKSASEELEKQVKVVADSPDVQRLTAIVDRIKPITEKPNQVYHIKVIEDGDINAFSLPGGYLYFTTGLLKAVESEDELAAVAGHEMAHICRAHSRRLMSRDQRYQMVLGSLVLASILSNSEGVNPGAVAVVGGLVAQDALNHYGREAELDADHQAVLYLKATGQYNPVAVLTVVEGLARLESERGNPELGVLKTHPYGKERVEAVSRQLQELGLPLERRRVTKSLRAEAVAVAKGDAEIGELRLNGRVVFQPAVAVDGVSPVARAQQSADLLEKLLLENLELVEISTAQQDGVAQVLARGQVVLAITPADAQFHQKDVGALRDQAMEAIRLGFSEERVRRAY
ncbi:MAG: M48 family metalloprotease [Armatimonadota bacterium]